MAIITTSTGILDDGNPLPYVTSESTTVVPPEADSTYSIYDDYPEGAYFTPTGWVPLEDVTKTVVNSVATTAEERQAMVAADGAALRLIYGRQRVGAQIAYLKEDQNYIYVVAVWCLGEINSVEEIYFDGATADGTFIVKVADYVGTTTQAYDSTLHGIDANYIDDLVLTKGTDDIGVAYSVLKIHVNSFPSRIEAIIQGKKVYNAAQTAKIYTTNPSLCLVDYIESPIYGQGKTVNAASIVTAANANDEIIPTTSDKRRELNLVIDKQAKTGTHIEVLRTYAGCFVINRGDEVKLVPNVEATSSRTLTNADIIDGTMKITKAGNNNLPTVMKIVYTDTTADPWKDAEAIVKASGVDAGTTPWRESTINLQGITSYGQAYREGVERLNKLTINDLGVEFQSFDESLQDEVGDVITVSHYYGLTSKELRILSVDPSSSGRWKIVAKEYNDNTYSDDVETTADSPDTTVPLPGHPIAPTITAVTEVVEEKADGTFVSRINIDWTAPDYPWIDSYYVFWSGPSKDNKGYSDSLDTEYLTPPVPELGSYQIKVSTISNGVKAEATDSIVLDGEPDYPEDPTDLVIDQKGSTVGVYIGTFTNSSTWKMIVKKEPETVSPDWDNATTVGIADSNSFIETESAVDDYTYLVKTIRSDGVESENYVTADVSVGTTEDTDWVSTLLSDSAANIAANSTILIEAGDTYVDGTSETGVYIGSAGIFQLNAGDTVFSLDDTGAGTFAGTLSAASGTFAGTVSSLKQVNCVVSADPEGIGAAGYFETVFSTSALIGNHNPTLGVAAGYGVYGYSDSTNGVGVYGASTSVTGGGYGVWGQSSYSSTPAIYAQASSSTGIALKLTGEIDCDLIPYKAGYNLGGNSSPQRWDNLFVNDINVENDITPTNTDCKIGGASDFFEYVYGKNSYHYNLFSDGAGQTSYTVNSITGSFAHDGVLEVMHPSTGVKTSYFYKFYTADRSADET